MRHGLILSLVLGLVAFAADRLHKHVQIEVLGVREGVFEPMLPFIDYGFIFNRGVSFGLLSSMPIWAVGIVILVALGALLVWWARSTARLVRAGLALCIGGALSNAIDRVLYGAVADFFWLHWGDFSFFVFNLADAAITAGVILLLLDLLGIGNGRRANAA